MGLQRRQEMLDYAHRRGAIIMGSAGGAMDLLTANGISGKTGTAYVSERSETC